MKGRICFLIASCGLLACAPAFSQSTFGAILGTLQDTSGAVIAGGDVEIRNLDENTSRKTVSNASGIYEFLNLPPGRYSLTANKAGFTTARAPEIGLEARQERRVDLALGLTSVQQNVEVQAAAAVINTENATISSTINNQQVTELPANYRGASTSPLGAIVALPNVQQDQNGAIALTGSLPFMTDYSVDGTSTVNVGSNAAARDLYPSSEMLAEFKVSAINNNAELASSGDVTVTTKSGGNAVHGSAFEYLQNRALDATTYGSSVKQAKVWNTFGGSLSGPVVLPKIYNGHNKTFFFVDYEGNRKPGSILGISNVPTAAMVAGNLNGVPGKPAVDPFTGQPFPNNQIPASELNPVAQTLLTKYYPGPNFDSGSTTGNYRTLLPLNNRTDGFDIRIDHNVSSRHLIYGRWTWKNIPYLSAANAGLSQLLPPATNNEKNRNLLVGDSFTISASTINEFRFGYSDLFLAQSLPFSGASVVSNLGLTGLDLSRAGNDGGFPGFNFSSGTGFSPIGHNDLGPSHSRTLQYTDNLTWTRGRHTAKFGIDWRTVRYSRVDTFGADDEYGSLRFNGAFSGNAFADLLLGLPATNLVFDLGPPIDQTSQHFATYAQDEFRISKSLTLNFGLRWELQPPFTEAHGNIANFNPVNGGMVIPDLAAKVLPPAAEVLYQINACPGVISTLPCSPVQTASQAGIPQGLRYTYYRNFDPRISLAWRPFGDNKTVFRAGWGVYTVPTLGGVAFQMTGLAATASLIYVNALKNGVPLFQLPSVAFGNGGLTPDIIGTYEYFLSQQMHFRDPQSAQWNVTVERQFGENWNTRVSYIGENSFRLGIDPDLNQIRASATPYNPLSVPYPQLGPIIQNGNWGFANYQALEVQVSHRMAAGLYLQGTFDWAKDLTDANGDAPLAFNTELANGSSGNGGTVVNDRFNLRSDRGNDSGVRRNRFLLTGLYQLPFGRGRRFGSNASRPVEAVLGGWQLSTITLLETGPYLTPYDSNPNDSQANLNEAGRGTLVRPDRIGNCGVQNPSPNGWFNLAAFVLTPAGAGRTGNSGVGICEGPGTVAVAGGLSKNFLLHEKFRLRFEATFTNILNHPNFVEPSTDVSSPSTFGITETVQSAENSGNRVGQLSLRLDF
ncbi:MAG TPA: TonB-dependent receptor [Bryobacteraceae bacterium]|jgi:hypothetical protein